MCSSLHTTSVGVMDATAPPVPRWTLETDCFRRPFRSHGPTLTLSVPEPLFRDVLLSSAKTLRRNSGLHATPAGVEDPTAPSHCWDAFQTDCFRRPFRSHGLTLTLLVPEPLFQAVLLSSAKTLRRNSGVHATPVGIEDPTAPPALVFPRTGPLSALPREQGYIYRTPPALSIVYAKHFFVTSYM